MVEKTRWQRFRDYFQDGAKTLAQNYNTPPYPSNMGVPKSAPVNPYGGNSNLNSNSPDPNKLPATMNTHAYGADAQGEQEPDPTTKYVIVHSQPVGTPGTYIYSGYMAEEYLQALKGRVRANVFDQMRRSDPQIIMCLSAVKHPILSAKWEVQAEDDEKQQLFKEFIEFNLFHNPNFTWREKLEEKLSMVDFGHSVQEIVHTVFADHPMFGTFHGLKNLAWRSPRTIERFNIYRPDGGLKSISQYAYGDEGKVVDIPAEFLIVYSVRKEGDNFEGISFLRPCYGAWKRKDVYLKLNAIGIEKFAVPTPIATVPNAYQNSEQFENLVSVLEAYTQNHNNYLTVPEGWKIDLHTNTYDPQKVEISIDNEDKRIAKAFLANFLELGSGGKGGAYALSKDQSDFYLMSILYLADMICDKMNQTVIRNLITINFGEQQEYPKLKVSGIDDKAGEELARGMDFLTRSKTIEPDDILEEHIRKRYGFPKKSDIGKRVTQEPGKQGGFGTMGESGQRSLLDRIRLAERRRKDAPDI